MQSFAGRSWDDAGIFDAGGALREWRTLTGVEVAPPLWTNVSGWDVTLFFASGEPVALRTRQDFLRREQVTELATLLRAALAASPTAIASARARMIVSLSDPAAPMDAASRALDLARARRDRAAAWRHWRAHRIRSAGAEDTESTLALIEETGRCPAELRERWEAELRAAMRDPVLLEKVTRLYLATNHEVAEPYARMLVQPPGKFPAVARGFARWLLRQSRTAEAAEFLREAVRHAAAPEAQQGLAADLLALERYQQSAAERWRAHRRRRLSWVGATVVSAAIIAVVVFHVRVGQRAELERQSAETIDRDAREARAETRRLRATPEEHRRFAELKKSAAAGDAAAMFELSRQYRIGRATRFDAELERSWLERAAAAGHARAQVALARLLQQGRGEVPRDPKAALPWLERAAAQGDIPARQRIMLAHRRGDGVARNYETALRLCRELAAEGDAWAMTQAVLFQLNGWHVPKDEAAAIAELRELAARDNGYAWGNLGSCYENGRGLSRDIAEARRCYEAGARLGDDDAVIALARLMNRGLGGPADRRRAEEMIRPLAEADLPLAQTLLAQMLFMPARSAEEQAEGRYWAERGANENHPPAKYTLAQIYLTKTSAQSVEATRARALLQSLAESGDTLAMNRLASLLRDGTGGPKEGAAALRWWHKAVDAGNVPAMLSLASVYEQGDESAKIFKDLPEARRLLERAAALNSAEAKRRLARLDAAAPAAATATWTPPSDLLENLPANGQPVPIRQLRPFYPFEMHRQNIEGEVVVDFLVDRDGSVKNAHALRSTRPEFEAAAVVAVRQWYFRPGTKNGQPVTTHMQVPIQFTLQDENVLVERPNPPGKKER